MEQHATAAAQALVTKLQNEKEMREREWLERRKRLKIDRRQDGVACFRLERGGKMAEVLLDDNAWLDIKAMGARLALNRNFRAEICIDGRLQILSRWLCKAKKSEVVDHVNHEIQDHRSDNLRVTDRAGNQQNSRGVGKNHCPHIGVSPVYNNSWMVKCKVKGEDRLVSRTFVDLNEAIELYDLATLHQHQEGALINIREKESEYLAKLNDEKTLQMVKGFLALRTPPSAFQGIRLSKKQWISKFTWKGQTVCKPFRMAIPGAEVKAAICYDLWRLQKDANLTLNFERMRPYYSYCNEHLEDQDERIEKSYRSLGGDAFARSLQVTDDDLDPNDG